MIWKFLCVVFLCVASLGALENEKPVLNGSAWDLYLLNYNGEILSTSHVAQKATLHFQAKKDFGGSSGCNTFFGSYKDSQQTLQFSNVGATKKMCDEKSMSIESALLMLFRDGGVSYTLYNDELVLERDLTKAVFKRTH
ncbi:META domain-containing protein [uncultured Helicobacter sp.]|uniref:META domain-containing protein n=1 Tax=uncultured Helicobacter sp. TaxID=175537 RepID=UPI00374F4511